MATDRRQRWQAASRNHTGALSSLRGARHEHTTTGTLGLRFLTVAGWLRRWLEDVPLTQADQWNSEAQNHMQRNNFRQWIAGSSNPEPTN